MTPKGITLSEAAHLQNALWVMNMSDNEGREPRYQLMTNLVYKGDNVNLVLPATWIPIDILTLVDMPIIDIIRSASFKTWYNRRDIIILDPEDAEKAMQDPDAVAEYRQLFGGRRNEETKSKLKVETENARLLSIVSGNLDEAQRMAALRNIQSSMKHEDYVYLISKVSDGRVKTWANAELAKLA